MSGIPARQQVASTLINLVIVLVMFAVLASVSMIVLVSLYTAARKSHRQRVGLVQFLGADIP